MIDYYNNLFYSGIGSRVCPEHIAKLQAAASKFISTRGYVLRSGYANGSDKNHSLNSTKSVDYVVKIPYNVIPTENKHFIVPNFEDYYEIMKTCCPHWKKLDEYSTKLHTRNICQGQGHFPEIPIYSKFCIAYTENGDLKGGSATMLRYCERRLIPIFNLGKYKIEEVRYSLRDFLKEHMRVESLDEFLARAKETAKYADIHRERYEKF